MKKMINGLMGLAVGDAMGVPYESKTREEMKQYPCTGMAGYGTYRQAPGVWSTKTGMTLCLADSLKSMNKVDCLDIMKKFQNLFIAGDYTAQGVVFDLVGRTTSDALDRFNGSNPFCGVNDTHHNDNGALMRILPMAYVNCTVQEVWQVCSITHGHEISKIACTLYVFIAKALLNGLTVKDGIEHGFQYFIANGMLYDLTKHFGRLPLLHELPEEEILSTGYVVNTLEAALWSLLTTNNFKDCILKAVNLGGDPGTVAAVAGGLAGIKYGVSGIPAKWKQLLKNKEMIEKVCKM